MRIRTDAEPTVDARVRVRIMAFTLMILPAPRAEYVSPWRASALWAGRAGGSAGPGTSPGPLPGLCGLPDVKRIAAVAGGLVGHRPAERHGVDRRRPEQPPEGSQRRSQFVA